MELNEPVYRLKVVCSDDKMFESAVKYCLLSPWSISKMTDYITAVGEIPDKKMMAFPTETLVFLKAGLLGGAFLKHDKTRG